MANVRARVATDVEMGRGLSPLQLDILKIAYRNWWDDRERPSDLRIHDDPVWSEFAKWLMSKIQPQIARREVVPFERPDLYTYEVLSRHFGFPIRPRVIFVDRESNNWNFNTRKIGRRNIHLPALLCPALSSDWNKEDWPKEFSRRITTRAALN